MDPSARVTRGRRPEVETHERIEEVSVMWLEAPESIKQGILVATQAAEAPV